MEIRPYQTRIDTRLAENWRRGYVSQLIVAPCGAGKTFMGLRGCRRLVDEIVPELTGIAPEEVGIFWMAMRSNLLEQAMKENAKFGHPVPEGQFHPVSSFATAPARGNYKFVVLVCDEAHHSASASESFVLEQLRPDLSIGLSATPLRTDSAMLCFQQTLRDAGYRTLIRDGYLSSFEHWLMEKWEPQHVARTYSREREKWGKSIFFYRTFAECTASLEQLHQDGVSSEIVHGGSDREKQLARLESGELDTLISMPILAEGLDLPCLQSVFVRDCGSRGLSTQMAGRVLRKYEGRVKYIVQSVKAEHQFSREADPACQHLQQPDGGWRSLTPSMLSRQLMEKTSRLMQSSAPVPAMPDWKLCKPNKHNMDVLNASLTINKHKKAKHHETPEDTDTDTDT